MELETIKALLESGADPEKLNDIKPRFYKRLASGGHTRILDMLLDKCSQNLKDKLDTDGLVYFAANQMGLKNRACVKMLFRKGFNIDQACPGEDFRAPIHAALINEDLELLNLLLECGASVVKMGGSDVAGFLLPYVTARERGFDETILSRLIPVDLNATYDHPRDEKIGMCEDYSLSIKGYSFLMLACLAAGSPDALQHLLDLGSDPNQCNNEGFGPLQAAMMTHYYDIADFLFPLTDLSACRWKDTDQVQWVLEQYIRKWWTDSEHQTHSKLLKMLLKAHADPNKPNPHGKFPLLIALEGAGVMKDVSDVDVLFSHGANPNIVGQGKENALWCAATSGYAPALEAVLDVNPDILLSDLKVKEDHWSHCTYTTAMQEALKAQNAELVNMCVEAGFCLEGSLAYLEKYSNYVSEFDEDKDPHWYKDINPGVVEKIKKFSNRPRRLEEIAKFSIRKCIQGGSWNVARKAKSLPLAEHQIEYLIDIGL